MAGKERTWPSMLLIAAGVLALIFIFLGESWVMKVIDKERQYNYQFYSAETAGQIENRALGWYKSVFVDTKIQETSFKQFSRETGPGTAQSPFDGTGMALYSWYEARTRAFWALMFQAMLRLSQLWLWLPIIAMCAIPWVVDGLVSRKIRQHTYQQSSHLQHHYALLGMSIIGLVCLAMLITPFAFPPLLIPIMALLFCVLLHRGLANYVKRA